MNRITQLSNAARLNVAGLVVTAAGMLLQIAAGSGLYPSLAGPIVLLVTAVDAAVGSVRTIAVLAGLAPRLRLPARPQRHRGGAALDRHVPAGIVVANPLPPEYLVQQAARALPSRWSRLSSAALPSPWSAALLGSVLLVAAAEGEARRTEA